MALPAENTKKRGDVGTKTKETSLARTRPRTRTMTDGQATEAQAFDTRARIPRSPAKQEPPRAPARPKPTTEIGTGPDPETPTRAPPFQLEEYSDIESEHSGDSNAPEYDDVEETQEPEKTAIEALEVVMSLMEKIESEELRELAMRKLAWATKLVKDEEGIKARVESDIVELKAAVKAAEEAKPTIEKDIAEIKAMLKGTSPSMSRTYAQTAARPLTQAQAEISHQIARGEQAEKLKRHREKTEVAVTMKTADPSFAKDMEALPLNAMANSIEEATNVWLKGKGEGPIKIATIRKLGKRS